MDRDVTFRSPMVKSDLLLTRPSTPTRPLPQHGLCRPIIKSPHFLLCSGHNYYDREGAWSLELTQMSVLGHFGGNLDKLMNASQDFSACSLKEC